MKLENEIFMLDFELLLNLSRNGFCFFTHGELELMLKLNFSVLSQNICWYFLISNKLELSLSLSLK